LADQDAGLISSCTDRVAGLAVTARSPLLMLSQPRRSTPLDASHRRFNHC
jgi:hypothetical protein